MLTTWVKTLYRFRLAKQQLCTCITLFCTFLCRHCTTTAWNFLFSRFMEGMNRKQQFSFSFPEIRYSLLEFNSRKVRHYLSELNEMEWTQQSLKQREFSFKWRFFICRRRCCSSSLIRLTMHGILLTMEGFQPIRITASSSGAWFFAWQRRARNASDWWWTARDHGKVIDGEPVRVICLSAAILFPRRLETLAVTTAMPKKTSPTRTTRTF